MGCNAGRDIAGLKEKEDDQLSEVQTETLTESIAVGFVCLMLASAYQSCLLLITRYASRWKPLEGHDRRHARGMIEKGTAGVLCTLRRQSFVPFSIVIGVAAIAA